LSIRLRKVSSKQVLIRQLLNVSLRRTDLCYLRRQLSVFILLEDRAALVKRQIVPERLETGGYQLRASDFWHLQGFAQQLQFFLEILYLRRKATAALRMIHDERRWNVNSYRRRR